MNQIYKIYYQIIREEIETRETRNSSPFIKRTEVRTVYTMDVEVPVDLEKISAIYGVGIGLRNGVPQDSNRLCSIHLENSVIELKEMPYGDFRALVDTWMGWKSNKEKEWRKESADAIWEGF